LPTFNTLVFSSPLTPFGFDWSIEAKNSSNDVLILNFNTGQKPPSLVGFASGTIDATHSSAALSSNSIAGNAAKAACDRRLSFIKTPFGPGLPVGNPRDAR
jgi:hypothetical protein